MPQTPTQSQAGFSLEAMERNRHFQKMIHLLCLRQGESPPEGRCLRRSVAYRKEPQGTILNQTTISSTPNTGEPNPAPEKHSDKSVLYTFCHLT